MDGLLKPPPPDAPKAGAPAVPPAAPDPATEGNYARYGMSGQFWHTHLLGCDDVAAVMGNAMANTVFSWAKALDRLTITTYQAAATEGPLESIKNVVDDIVTRLSNALYWPFLRPIVILGAIWLAWYGLIRKRATTTAEGVIWMVLAVTVAVWFFSRPGDFTGLGKTVTDATGEVVNSAFSGLPGAGGATCLPGKGETNPQAKPGGYGQTGRARRRPERRRALVHPGLQAVADGRVRHGRRQRPRGEGVRGQAAGHPGARRDRDGRPPRPSAPAPTRRDTRRRSRTSCRTPRSSSSSRARTGRTGWESRSAR